MTQFKNKPLILCAFFLSLGQAKAAGVNSGGGGGVTLEAFRKVGLDLMYFFEETKLGQEYAQTKNLDLNCLRVSISDQNIQLVDEVPTINSLNREAVVDGSSLITPFKIILSVRHGDLINYTHAFVAKEMLRSCDRNDLVNQEDHFTIADHFIEESYLTSELSQKQRKFYNFDLAEKLLKRNNVQDLQREIPLYGPKVDNLFDMYTLLVHNEYTSSIIHYGYNDPNPKPNTSIPVEVFSAEPQEREKLSQYFKTLVEKAGYFSIQISPFDFESGISWAEPESRRAFGWTGNSLRDDDIAVRLYFVIPDEDKTFETRSFGLPDYWGDHSGGKYYKIVNATIYRFHFIVNKKSLTPQTLTDLKALSDAIRAKNGYEKELLHFKYGNLVSRINYPTHSGERMGLPVLKTVYSTRNWVGWKTKHSERKEALARIMEIALQDAYQNDKSAELSVYDPDLWESKFFQPNVEDFLSRSLIFFNSQNTPLSVGQMVSRMYDYMRPTLQVHADRYARALIDLKAGVIENDPNELRKEDARRRLEFQLNGEVDFVESYAGRDAWNRMRSYLGFHLLTKDILKAEGMAFEPVTLTPEMLESQHWENFKNSIHKKRIYRTIEKSFFPAD